MFDYYDTKVFINNSDVASFIGNICPCNKFLYTDLKFWQLNTSRAWSLCPHFVLLILSWGGVCNKISLFEQEPDFSLFRTIIFRISI